MHKYFIVLALLILISACNTVPSEDNSSSEGTSVANNSSPVCETISSPNNEEKDSQNTISFLGSYIHLPSVDFPQYTIEQTNIEQFFNPACDPTNATQIISPTGEHLASWVIETGDCPLANVYIDQSELPSFTIRLSPLLPQDIHNYLRWISDTKLSIGAGVAFYNVETQLYDEVPLPQSEELYGVHIYRKYTLDMLDVNPSATKAVYAYYADDHVALSVFNLITKEWTIVHRAIPSIYDPYTATWIDDDRLLFATYQLAIDENMPLEERCSLLNRIAVDGLAEKDMPAEHLLYIYDVTDQTKVMQGKIEGFQAIKAQNGQMLFSANGELLVYNGYTNKLICRFSQEGGPLLLSPNYVVFNALTEVTVVDWEKQFKLKITMPYPNYYIYQNNFFCKQDNNWYVYAK